MYEISSYFRELFKKNCLTGFFLVLWIKTRTTSVKKVAQPPKKVIVLWNIPKKLQLIFFGTRRFLFLEEKGKVIRSVFRRPDTTLKLFWHKWLRCCCSGYVERRYDITSEDCFAQSQKISFLIFFKNFRTRVSYRHVDCCFHDTSDERFVQYSNMFILSRTFLKNRYSKKPCGWMERR